jgi:hypothetical protein
MSEQAVPPPTPSDALTGDAITDALDEVKGFLDEAWYRINDVTDEPTYRTLAALGEAIKHLRFAATILTAEVGALNEVTQ